MTTCHKSFNLTTPARPAFHDVTEQVKRIVTNSGIANGLVCVYSQHTTCSVIIQEEAHDETYHGTKFILQDLLNIFEKIAPTCTAQGQYIHPGPEHIAYATSHGEEAWWSLNTDAHMRSVLLGRSENIPVVDGQLELGEFGQVYFVDFDQVRERERTVRVQIVGE